MLIDLFEFVLLSLQGFFAVNFNGFYMWPMKWTLVAFVSSLLAGYCVYDEFDPGTLYYDVDE